MALCGQVLGVKVTTPLDQLSTIHLTRWCWRDIYHRAFPWRAGNDVINVVSRIRGILSSLPKSLIRPLPVVLVQTALASLLATSHLPALLVVPVTTPSASVQT